MYIASDHVQKIHHILLQKHVYYNKFVISIQMMEFTKCNSIFYSHGVYTIFLPSETENATFAIRCWEQKWYFRPTRQKIYFCKIYKLQVIYKCKFKKCIQVYINLKNFTIDRNMLLKLV